MAALHALRHLLRRLRRAGRPRPARTVLVMAGGTGGHVYPALAAARVLAERGWRVVWLGAPDSFEARRVPAAGFPLEEIPVAGLRGKGLKTLAGAPWRVARSVVAARRVLQRVRPDAVLGMGGFVAGPGALAARLLGIPLVIHEQNARAGLTNRVLARLASVVLEAYPGSLPGFRARVVGNPVRAEFGDTPPPAARFAGRQGRLRVLVVGGSQGAQALNTLVPEALALLPEDLRPTVVHQGGRTLAVAEAAYASGHVAAETRAFLDDMPARLADTDLVIARAGASTLAEISAVGVAALLVPFPHAVDDHQTANAGHLVAAGAALLLPEATLSAAALAEQLTRFDRPHLLAMATAARGLAQPGADTAIADAVVEAARRTRRARRHPPGGVPAPDQTLPP